MSAGKTYIKIASQTASGSSTSITFSNIPQDYTDLVIIGSTRNTNNTYQPYIQFNSDTGTGTTNYSTTSLRGDGSSAASSRHSSNIGWYPVPGPGVGTTGNFQPWIVNIMNYSNSSVFKSGLSRYNNASSFVTINSHLWRATQAITSITITAESGAGNIVSGSTFTLYGIEAAKAPKAIGGDKIYTTGTHWVHEFYNSGLFVPQVALSNVDYLVVAGGGGGSGANGGADAGNGGGGAGGLRSTVTATGGGGSLESSLSLSASTGYTVTVGAGGAGGAGGVATTDGTNGNNSVFATITSIGGSGGNDYGGSATTTGGSGGGAGAGASNRSLGTANQGFNGGTSSPNAGGGGGGAGALGSNGSSNTGGAGGAGVSVAITGSSITYAGGGGAGGKSTGGSGGSSIGGSGGSGNQNGTSGTTNTGSGGGGAGGVLPSGINVGGSGGSGIVIVRYAV